MHNGLILIGGWVAERFKAPVLKTGAVYAENLGIASNSAMEIAETRREVEFRAGAQSGTHGPVMLMETAEMTDDAIRKAVADAIHRNWEEYARADFPKQADAVIAAYETALALKCAELEDEMKLLHGERLDQGKTEITPDAIREAVARALTIADSDDPDRETGIKARPVLWMVNLESADAAIAAYEAARAKAIVIRREVDGRWIGEVPDLPGVMAYGATESETRRLTEALALRVVADRIEHGEASPAYYGTTYVKAEPQPMPTTHLERARKLVGSDYQPNTCNVCGGIYPNPDCDYICKARDAGKAIPCEAVGDTDLCVAVAAEFAAIERETLERTIRSGADAVVEAERLAIEALARHV